MLKTLAIAATLSLLASAAAAAPALDAKGKCRDSGKFVAAAMCKAPAAPAAGHCRDAKTKKFAKCGVAGTEPIPSKK